MLRDRCENSNSQVGKIKRFLFYKFVKLTRSQLTRAKQNKKKIQLRLRILH